MGSVLVAVERKVLHLRHGGAVSLELVHAALVEEEDGGNLLDSEAVDSSVALRGIELGNNNLALEFRSKLSPLGPKVAAVRAPANKMN